MKQGPERELVARYLDRAVASGKPLGLSGFSVTELTESRAGSAASRKAEEAKMPAVFPEGTIPLTRSNKGALPLEIAQTVAFLCSDAARHITGTPIYVDGAQSLLI